MKINSQFNLRALLKIGFLSAATVASLNAFAQYAINWHTMDGGGGTSTGGVYRVNGTIGQPDASVAGTNGQYSVTGGFWSGVMVLQSAGAPLLSIKLLSEGQALLSWPVNVSGFALEEATSVNGTWTNTPQAVVDTASEHTVTVPATGVIKVFRLKK
jgi:hypothetical protein